METENKKPKVILIKKVDRQHPVYLSRPKSEVEEVVEEEIKFVNFELENEKLTEL